MFAVVVVTVDEGTPKASVKFTGTEAATMSSDFELDRFLLSLDLLWDLDLDLDLYPFLDLDLWPLFLDLDLECWHLSTDLDLPRLLGDVEYLNECLCLSTDLDHRRLNRLDLSYHEPNL